MKERDIRRSPTNCRFAGLGLCLRNAGLSPVVGQNQVEYYLTDGHRGGSVAYYTARGQL